jgi:hypothetical protein
MSRPPETSISPGGLGPGRNCDRNAGPAMADLCIMAADRGKRGTAAAICGSRVTNAASAPTFAATDQDDDEKKSIAGSHIDLPVFDSAS